VNKEHDVRNVLYALDEAKRDTPCKADPQLQLDIRYEYNAKDEAIRTLKAVTMGSVRVKSKYVSIGRKETGDSCTYKAAVCTKSVSMSTN